MEIENELHKAEVRRLEAERHKLELEAKEIERRLSTRWWQSSKFPQYFVAIIITSALLFGWTRAYLEPMLRREAELNILTERRNATLNALLDAENKNLSVQRENLKVQMNKLEMQRDQLKAKTDDLKAAQKQAQVKSARLSYESQELKKDLERLGKERDQLSVERKILEKNQEMLRVVVAGLKIAVDQVAKRKSKFFSILNSGDPINKLSRSYGWKIWSDNYFGQLGYYLVIRHDNISSGKKIFVAREIEIDKLKQEEPKKWTWHIKQINEAAPVLALDYTYFGLMTDESAPVGGKIYRKGKDVIEFYAPLSEWAEKLGELFQKD